MQFQGAITNCKSTIEDVIGALDANYRSGRFVLKAGQHLTLGHHVLEIGRVRYAIRITYVIGVPGKPQCYEFVCTNGLGLAN